MERRRDQLVLGHHRVGADYGRLLIAVLVSHRCYDSGSQAVSLRVPQGADVLEASRPAATVRLNAASFRAVEEARGILADLVTLIARRERGEEVGAPASSQSPPDELG